MSRYLSCVFECESIARAEDIFNLMGRVTRPIFEEDVAEHLVNEFEVIEGVEYPDVIELRQNLIIASWFGRSDFDVIHLLPTLRLNGISLVIAKQVETYEGSEDEGDFGRGYWRSVDASIVRLSEIDLANRDYSNEIRYMGEQDTE